MSQIRALGLDLSLTSTGIAVVEVDDEAGAFMVLRSQAVPAANLRGAERLATIRTAVLSVAANTVPHLAAIEGYSFGSISLAHSIGELGGVVKVALHEAGIPVEVLAPAEWRKQLLGRGNLAKDEVKLETFVRYGVRFDSTDVCEAFCVALAAARRSLGLDTPAPVDRKRRRQVAEASA